MIWITTLCLLALGSWFLFNALNERRWVQAHSHDESVASDPGLFPGFSSATGSGVPDENGKISIDQENSGFARAVAKVQEKTNGLGEKFFESKAAAARIDDDAERPASVRDEDTFFGRAVARISEKTSSFEQRLDEKMKAAASTTSSSSASGDPSETLLQRTSRKVAEKSHDISSQVANRAKNISQGYTSAAKDDGMFGKMVKSVSGGIEKIESKVDSKLSSAKSDDGEDLITRVASKVGSKVNELSSKTGQRKDSNADSAD